MIQKPKGTYDMYGKDADTLLALQELAISLCKRYNFDFIKTPMFEKSELFHRSVGESSDIVRKETYDFIDKGERSMTLRPEGTAGVVRCFIEDKMYVNSRVNKLFYFSNNFRYERPQKGRFREHTQFGVELFGSDSPYTDAEIISIGVTYFKLLGLPNVKVKINSLGNPESRENYRKALVEYFEPSINELCPDCKDRLEKNALRILDCKVDGDSEIVKNAPKMSSYLDKESSEYFEKVKESLTTLGIEYEIDENLVRGFDYYTHTIFEFEYDDESGSSENVIGGGGRYDLLVEMLDGPSTPAMGFGIGLERIIMVLEKCGIDLVGEKALDVLVYAFPEVKDSGLELAYNLRVNGFVTDINYDINNMKQLFKLAEALKPKYIVILGEEEVKTGTLKIKNYQEETEETIEVNKIIDYLDERLD